MAGLIETWRDLTAQRKAIVVAAVAATVIALGALARTASTPRMTLLYAGLEPEASGEVLTALESMDVAASVRGDAIFVPEPERDRVRMALARDGLPRQGQAGFELLDDLNGFATTADMFDATFWRAKEGELARTIAASPGVRSARVHLAIPKVSAFSRGGRRASASVTIAMTRGRLDPQHALAARFLVALAIPDLEPEQVAVLDAQYGVILAPGTDNPLADPAGDAETRERALESDLIDLLEARVGAGNARVQVALTVDRAAEKVTERLLDPESRVMMSRETSDMQESGAAGAGVVTVASNLPDGDAAATTSPPQSSRSETSEAARFDISEIRREREVAPGAVSRINVAVLVNDVAGENGEAPARAVEELEALRELVASAIGFDEARGDTVTVKAMEFHVAAPEGEIAAPGIFDFVQQNLMSILQIVIPAIVVIVLAIFVIGPLLRAGARKEPPAIAAPQSGAPAVVAADKPKSPVERLHDVASAQSDASVGVLKSWLEEEAAA